MGISTIEYSTQSMEVSWLGSLCYQGSREQVDTLEASAFVIPSFMCWMIWVTVFIQEALVMDFTRALYH
jgi:hypothetical protein